MHCSRTECCTVHSKAIIQCNILLYCIYCIRVGIFVLAPHPSMLHIFHGVLGQSTESFRSEPERNHQKINQIYLSVYLVDPFLFFFHADTFSFTLATLEGLRFFRHARLSFKYFQILQILFLNKLDHRARNIGHLDPPFGSKQHAQPFYTYIMLQSVGDKNGSQTLNIRWYKFERTRLNH